MTLYKYEGFFYDSREECWLAVVGGGEFTRWQLEATDPSTVSAEQMAEVAKALAELPGDDIAPKRGQRKKPVPAEGQFAEDVTE